MRDQISFRKYQLQLLLNQIKWESVYGTGRDEDQLTWYRYVPVLLTKTKTT